MACLKLDIVLLMGEDILLAFFKGKEESLRNRIKLSSGENAHIKTLAASRIILALIVGIVALLKALGTVVIGVVELSLYESGAEYSDLYIGNSHGLHHQVQVRRHQSRKDAG